MELVSSAFDFQETYFFKDFCLWGVLPACMSVYLMHVDMQGAQKPKAGGT